MRALVFDVETRIDKELVRDVFFRGEGLGEEEAYGRMRERLQEESGRDFFPLSCHRPVSIAIGEVDDDLRLTALQTLAGGEDAIVREFWRRVESLEGLLVSFNGKSFDLPVLELQALRLGLSLPGYFGEPRRFRSRGADRHLDLYDFLANGNRLRGGFDLVARLAGLAGKSEMDGSRVQTEWEAGNLAAIDRYCRDDVLQTYLLFLHIERMRGRLETDACQRLSRDAERLAAQSP